jgi:hypothetical protein
VYVRVLLFKIKEMEQVEASKAEAPKGAKGGAKSRGDLFVSLHIVGVCLLYHQEKRRERKRERHQRCGPLSEG